MFNRSCMSVTKKVRTFIRNIEALDKSHDYSYEAIIREFFMLGRIPMLVYKIEKGKVFYRARYNDGTSFYNKSQIANPPSRGIHSFGRLNKPNQSIFYCSNRRPTAYLEVIDNLYLSTQNSHFSISLGDWVLAGGIEVIPVVNTEKSTWRSIAEEEMGKILKELIIREAKTTDQKNGYEEFFNYMSLKYQQSEETEKDLYKLTTAYANLVFLRGHQGLIYPSVADATEKRGINYVFHSSVVSSGQLQLIEVQRDDFQVERDPKGKIKGILNNTPPIKAKFDVITSQIVWPD